MPSLHGLHNGRAAIVPVGVIDAAKYTEFRQTKQPLLQGLRRYRALIDTGATATMITTKVISELGLDPVSKRRYQGVSGPMWRTTYLFNIAFYEDQPSNDDDMSGPDGVVSRSYVFGKVIQGAEIADEPSFDVLLGMDVISSGDLSIRRNGTFEFSF